MGACQKKDLHTAQFKSSHFCIVIIAFVKIISKGNLECFYPKYFVVITNIFEGCFFVRDLNAVTILSGSYCSVRHREFAWCLLLEDKLRERRQTFPAYVRQIHAISRRLCILCFHLSVCRRSHLLASFDRGSF